MAIQDARRYVPKLRALHDLFAKHLEDKRARYFHPMRFAELHTLYSPIRDDLRSVDTFTDLPARDAPKVTATTDNEGLGYIERREIEPTLEDIAYILKILEHPMTAESPIVLNREGLFVAGQTFDAMRSIAEILASAKTSIVIVDGYVGENTLNLCAGKQPGATVEILTYDKSTTPTFRRWPTLSTSSTTGSPSERRRRSMIASVVIDGTEHFHVGSSIKDAGSRGFMFSRIEEPSIIAAFAAAWTTTWSGASVFI
jgi:hypothetical protein